MSFENPCLTAADLVEGNNSRSVKTNDEPIKFCYAGRLEREKGVERIIEAFNRLDESLAGKVGKVHLVGNGSALEYFKALSEESNIRFEFHGFLPTDKLFKIYQESHFFLMPTTASEGFPKVIAEAMNFGCIPIVSDVSSIGQYVKEKTNGLIISPVNELEVQKKISEALEMNKKFYTYLVSNACLLYTSPSPRDRTRSRMPSSA